MDTNRLSLPPSQQEKASASFVGFANLPNQVFRKAVKRGFQFSLMVVGELISLAFLLSYDCISSHINFLSSLIEFCCIRPYFIISVLTLPLPHTYIHTYMSTHTHTHTHTCTGQSGLGKSTLINSLFMTDIYEDSTYPDPVVRMPQTTQVRNYA